jgi:hypothetical protein
MRPSVAVHVAKSEVSKAGVKSGRDGSNVSQEAAVSFLDSH